MFTPYVDDSIKDKAISTHYAKRVVGSIDPQQTNTFGEHLDTTISQKKSRLVFIALMIGFSILLIRLFFLQVIQGNNWRAIADGNRIRIEYVSAPRGIIFDHNNQILVKNVPNFIITITPANLPKDLEQQSITLAKAAHIIQIPEDQLHQQLNEHKKKFYSQPLVIKSFIPYEEALTLATKLTNLPGIALKVQPSRDYTDTLALSHLLGYLGKVTPKDLETKSEEISNEYLLSDVLGKAGLELYYEDILRGHKGKQQIEVNPQGNQIEVLAKEDPIPGNNIVLAMDENLQRNLYDGLEQVSEKLKTPGGAAVAMDPRTGKILALVSYPGFDANFFTKGIDQATYETLINDERKPLFNKAVLGEYPSGSTFKLVIAAAALEEGVVTPETTVNSTGSVRINQSIFKDYKSGGHGITDMRKALAESVNTYFYYAGGGYYNPDTNTIDGGLGIDRIDQYAQLFGLSSPLGIDLPNEASGFLPSREWKETVKGETWHIGDTYNTSIGQGDVLVTPLQVAAYTSVIANGGTLYQPELVQYTTNQAGEVQSSTQPQVINTGFISPENIRVVQEGMRQAVTDGSARRMGTLPVTSAAKTGTAQIAGTELTHAWFTMYAPYENPEIALTVLVEKGGEGSDTALTVAKQALEEYFAR